jgi:hypothetical protein
MKPLVMSFEAQENVCREELMTTSAKDARNPMFFEMKMEIFCGYRC